MDREQSPTHDLFDRDEVRSVLEVGFYETAPARPTRGGKKKAAKADHYEIICISMYNEDLAQLDAKVAELKQAGHRRMTRSALIRYALAKLEVGDVPAPTF